MARLVVQGPVNKTPEQATQVPETMRPAKRWRIAFKVWVWTTLFVAATATPCILLIEFVIRHVFHGHSDYHPIRVGLLVILVAGISGVPTFIKVFLSYPPGRAGAWHRSLK